MKQFSWLDRLRYRFDNIMARGSIALLGLLFVASALFILALAFLVWVSGVDLQPDGTHFSFDMLVWMMVLRTLDPGTMGGDRGSDLFLGAMLLVTLGGIFIVSILIGIIGSGIQARIEDLRRGRSIVVEQGHTVILGWSPNIFTVISELVLANENKRNQCVAILANQDKVEMEQEIRAHIPDTRSTRIVCRTGAPIEPLDLDLVNPSAARSIIVLAPETPNPDSEVVKTLLALVHTPQPGTAQYRIVAEIRDSKTMALAELVGRNQARFVRADELVNHIFVQTCRFSGLSAVWDELLGFAGQEIYFYDSQDWQGKSFGEALFALTSAALMGVRTREGRVWLAPLYERRFEPGDQLIVIADDDNPLQFEKFDASAIQVDALITTPPTPRRAERLLLLNWNDHAPQILRELDEYATPHSSVTLVSPDAAILDQANDIRTTLKRLDLTMQRGEPTDRRVLEELNLGSYERIIVLGGNAANVQQADANTLMTLLHLRDLRESGGYKFFIISEMQDVRNRSLAQVTRADDFIVSEQLASAMLAQVSENQELVRVFEELFNPEGIELYLKPLGDYVTLERPVNFYTVLEAARRRNEVALGYLSNADAHGSGSTHRVMLNPPKQERVTFHATDQIVVLGED